MWRRFCFTLKGDDLTILQGNNFTWWRATASQGVVRNLVSVFGYANALTAFKDLVFDGSEGVDWVDFFNAKLDSKRIGVKYDKTIVINSGNASGVIRHFNRWHPMNANIEYDDEETSGTVTTNPYSVDSKPGMGDYYVVDMFKAVGTTTDTLSFGCEAKLYWHEK